MNPQNRINIDDKLILPKNIYKNHNQWGVKFFSKKLKKELFAGNYKSISEAIMARDKFISENINSDLEGYLPKGLTLRKGVYKVTFCYKGYREYLGSYYNIKDAIEARNKYIDSLK